MRLYELTAEYRALLEADVDEETVEAFEARLQELGGEIAAKAEGTVCVCRTLEAEAKALREEEVRLAARRRAIVAKAERLEKYLIACLREAGQPSVKTRLFSIRVGEPKDSLTITDPGLIPEEYRHQEWVTHNAEIKAALLQKKDVPGAELKKGDYYLVVK